MKPNPIATRALAGMLPAMALFATPAFAQDAAQPAAVPPPTVVVPTPPAAEPAPPVAAAPEAPAATGPSAEDRAKFEASATAATGTASSAAAEAAPAAETRRAPARPVARAAATPARVTRAPAAPVQASPAVTEAAPAPVAPAAPTATTPVPDAPMTTPIPEEPVAAAPTTADTATTETTTESGGVPVWGWVLGAIAILGAIAAVVGLRRRRNENVWEEEAVYEEPAYVEPVAVAPVATAPIAAAPVGDTVVEDHAEVVTPAADEVAAITAASAPVTGRPWIELSLRPVRAGATDESAIVDLELTLANAGEVEARNVRVSTFMLGDASEAPSDMDRLLATNHGGTEVSAGQIGAGEGSRVDATLAVPRGELDGPTFQPIVVADVRYALPDGSEGRTAAAFAVGVDDGTEEPTPLRLGGDMRDDVAATLHGVLERA